MMIGGIILNGLILGFILLIFLGEDLQENFMPAVAAVGIPSIVSIFPNMYFEGWIGYFLSLGVFLGGFYYLLSAFFDLSPGGAIKLMGIFLVCRTFVGLLLGLLLST